MSFGTRAEPQDHLPKQAPSLTPAERVAAMEARRQAQITNQIATINRLLKDGSYEGEMAKLHAELAEVTGRVALVLSELAEARARMSNAFVRDLIDAISAELRGDPGE